MKKSFKKLLIFIIIVVLIILAVIYFKKWYKGKVNNADEYTIGKDSVISIKSVVGVRNIENKISTLEKGVNTTKYVYKVDSNITDDIQKYIDKLKENGFLTIKDADFSQTTSTAKLGKSSVEEDYVIIVQIDYDTTGYTVSVSKGTGTISTQ